MLNNAKLIYSLPALELDEYTGEPLFRGTPAIEFEDADGRKTFCGIYTALLDGWSPSTTEMQTIELHNKIAALVNSADLRAMSQIQLQQLKEQEKTNATLNKLVSIFERASLSVHGGGKHGN